MSPWFSFKHEKHENHERKKCFFSCFLCLSWLILFFTEPWTEEWPPCKDGFETRLYAQCCTINSRRSKMLRGMMPRYNFHRRSPSEKPNIFRVFLMDSTQLTTGRGGRWKSLGNRLSWIKNLNLTALSLHSLSLCASPCPRGLMRTVRPCSQARCHYVKNF